MIGYNNILICRLDFEVISEQMALLTKIHRHSEIRGRHPVFYSQNLSIQSWFINNITLLLVFSNSV